jgi:hypothetical protein
MGGVAAKVVAGDFTSSSVSTKYQEPVAIRLSPRGGMACSEKNGCTVAFRLDIPFPIDRHVLKGKG